MTLTDQVIKNIIKRLIKGQDYRIEVIALINAEFLQFAIEFFKQIVDAKLKNKDLTQDWYKNYFLDTKLTSKEIAINSGLNTKTITNMYNSASKQIVINASNEHYDVLYESISNLIENENEIDLTLTIKFRGVSVDLNINESLIVINTLAVKRAALRGGLWSTAGKKVEKYLMASLCYLFDVPLVHFDQTNIPESMREVDFYLINNENYYRCEVKLMGKGNPESADAIFARETNIFVADKLSDLNKQQANILGVNWIELRGENGFMKFAKILEKLKIPHHSLSEDLDTKVTKILTQLIDIK
ncbi:MAG: CfrBI family restriction endonuclease [Cyanobacterium sp. T60_A2020_053]|nr:CfrBI family restriction endonuclease [Cyanobacterium sp. T60_A2020_053]